MSVLNQKPLEKLCHSFIMAFAVLMGVIALFPMILPLSSGAVLHERNNQEQVATRKIFLHKKKVPTNRNTNDDTLGEFIEKNKLTEDRVKFDYRTKNQKKQEISNKVAKIALESNNAASEKTALLITNAVLDIIPPQVPIPIVLGIVEQETSWRSKITSWDGTSHGPMQVNYTVWKKTCNLNSPKELYDTNRGVDCGIKVFYHYLEANNGDIKKALRQYRGSTYKSTNNEYAQKVIERARKYQLIVAQL